MASAADLRRIALALPDVSEGAHMDHPDFRCCGRVIASIHPGDAEGMVRVAAATQRALVEAAPAGFRPANGAWGRQGCTIVTLAAVTKAQLRGAVEAAWQFANESPRRPPPRAKRPPARPRKAKR